MKETVRTFLPRRVRAHTVLRGPLRGVRLVTSWHDYPGAILGRTEAPLLEWFEENVKQGETWLDVGAHYGYTAIALGRLVGPAGRVIAFEPMLSTAGHLNETRRLNNLNQLEVVPFALTDADSLTAIDLPVERGMASPVSEKPAGTERIYAIAFDRLGGSLSVDRLDGVKIDVQGFEQATLRGMEESLTRFAPKLVLEFHAGVDRGHILAILERCGYSIEGHRIDAPGGSAGEFDDDISYAFAPREGVHA